MSLLISVLPGCATYLDAKDATRAGGSIDQQKAAANAQMVAARTQNTALQDQQMQRENELARMDKRIQSAQSDLAKQNVELAEALKARKLTQTRHDSIKRDLNAIQAEMGTLDLQNKASAGSKSNDAVARASQEKKLSELEAKKKELENVLSALVKR